MKRTLLPTLALAVGLVGLTIATQGMAQAPIPVPALPASLTVPAGTIITVEIDERLSSSRQHPGDSFAASLRQPIVVDGWVVARPGQTVVGRIDAAARAGNVKGTSKLSLALQELVLVDGQQVPVRTQSIQRSGQTAQGRDAGAVATTAGIGTVIGAAAGDGSGNSGEGAAIGAATGAGAGLAGVLLTPGPATEVSPETVLAFQLTEPLVISTERGAQAYLPVTASDYNSVNRGAPVLREGSRPQVRRTSEVGVIVGAGTRRGRY